MKEKERDKHMDIEEVRERHILRNKQKERERERYTNRKKKTNTG
jgi:hypothetical protein